MTPILIKISSTHTEVTTRGETTISPPWSGLRAAVSHALAVDDGPLACRAPSPPLCAEAVLDDDWHDLDDDLQLLGGLRLGGA